MADEAERLVMERCIDRAPDDPAAYAVLGDWLSQRGEPRGELIALQLLPTLDRNQRERVKTLQALRGIRCLSGPLTQWRWGFVHSATLLRPLGGDDAMPLAKFLEHPSARFLRALTLGHEPLGESLDLVTRRAPPVLESLSVYSPRPVELPRLPQGVALARLCLSTPEVEGALRAMPTLRTLEVAHLLWHPGSAYALFEANAANLSQLKLVFTEQPSREALEALGELRALTHLTIEANTLSVDDVELLADLRVRTLDLSRSGLTERAARRMAQRAKTMTALSTLVLGEGVDP